LALVPVECVTFGSSLTGCRTVRYRVMSVARIRGRSGAAARRRHWALRRKRGTTLVEAVLYISIATAVMIFSIGLMREEQVRRERTAMAAELQQVTTAAQTYVSANYQNIRTQLFNDTAASADLIRVYNMAQPVAQGFLPAVFTQNGSTPKSFVGSLQFGLAVRAVLRSDAGVPPPTQQRTNALIEPGSTPPRFLDILTDNLFEDDPATPQVENDEIDLEALLITVSSDSCVIVPAAQGPRIVSQSESTAVGYVTGLGNGQAVPATCSPDVQSNLAWTGIEPGATGLMATGPYGSWRLLLAPYSGLTLTVAQFPDRGGQVFDGKTAVQAGRFASLLALQDRPPLSESAKIAREGDSALKCRGVPPNSAQELECRQGDQMYADLSFTSWDSDNDGFNDQNPGLLNVNTLRMADPSDSDGDGVNDVFPGLENVSSIEMAPPSDSDNNGVVDVFPGLEEVNSIEMAVKKDANGNPVATTGPAQYTNVLSLSCTTGNNAVTSQPGRFNVDCPTTQTQGLVVTGTATFEGGISGDVDVTGEVSAASAKIDSQLAVGEAPTGNNLPTGEILLNGTNVADKLTARLSHTFSDDDSLEVTKPKCQSGFSPDILVLPVAFETNEDLRGVSTEVTSNTGSWEVNLKVKEETNGQGNALRTITNPEDSEVVVLTGCKRN
jgi:hypothetical protein